MFCVDVQLDPDFMNWLMTENVREYCNLFVSFTLKNKETVSLNLNVVKNCECKIKLSNKGEMLTEPQYLIAFLKKNGKEPLVMKRAIMNTCIELMYNNQMLNSDEVVYASAFYLEGD